MSSENVGRKKSHRWASASQATYDGADWNSSDSDEDHAISNEEAQPNVTKLPSLPKLNYTSNEEEEEGKLTDNAEENGKLPNSEEEERPTLHITTEDETDRSSSNNESKSSLNRTRRNSPMRGVNTDLDNLMLQISKEMTPKLENEPVFPPRDSPTSASREGSTPFYNASSVIQQPNDAREGEREVNENDNDDDDDDDYELSKNGYFSDYMREGSDHEPEDNTPSHSHTESDVLDSPVAEEMQTEPQASTEEQEPDHNRVATNERVINEHLASNNNEVISKPSVFELENASAPIPQSITLRHTSKTNLIHPEQETSNFDEEKNKEDDYEETDETDDDFDTLSYTESIKYPNSATYSKFNHTDEPLPISDDDFKFSTKNRQSILQSSSEEEGEENDDHSLQNSSDMESFKVSESGYFEKLLEEDEMNPSTDQESHHEELDKEENNSEGTEDDILSIPASIESDKVEENPEGINKEADETSEKEKDRESENSKSGDDQETTITEGDSSRDSINLGSWKPDTDAIRSGFVQDTNKRAPPGFVYDENGKLVDLTPSSMKPRVVSTYSEMESTWAAFPSNGNPENNEDLETIKDTKTLYDNNTIFNVPGIMTNNENLPPLPKNVNIEQGSLPVARTLTAGSEVDKKSIKSIHSEGPSVHKPDSYEMAKLSDQDPLPELDLNELISSKASHLSKIEQLQAYSQSLADYDSGIQTWINYTLKSSSKADRDYLFDEYKKNEHVREAYANAEDLSRKNTVINTVASVNQNVSHLRKKVFSHSMKPRGLLSTIGKKIIERET
ncbi:hypothetical protein NCAS_0A07180 [Naumovozyma castellii]|uniref:Protein FYV8 n=1 Tax=Naumovozyma castellii TaxID=27288 RepID=G0V728_NAUCA|nr:hypothetical protein NCAS_0A07180 [Naumovozyma castellii CBS 4309]CCC67276.1 hypothetical protein NCAS_0A07180 [Naumovozyma castellii CBS 4309]